MSNVRTQMEKCEVEISGEEKNARRVICILRLRHFNQLLYMMVCTCVRVYVCACVQNTQLFIGITLNIRICYG